MPDQLQVELVSADRLVWSGEAVMVIAKTAEGDIGILRNHAPVLSVMVEGAPLMDPEVYDLGVPILGICYGAQLIAQQLGGTVGRGMRGEYGRAKLRRTGPSLLLPEIGRAHV